MDDDFILAFALIPIVCIGVAIYLAISMIVAVWQYVLIGIGTIIAVVLLIIGVLLIRDWIKEHNKQRRSRG